MKNDCVNRSLSLYDLHNKRKRYFRAFCTYVCERIQFLFLSFSFAWFLLSMFASLRLCVVFVRFVFQLPPFTHILECNVSNGKFSYLYAINAIASSNVLLLPAKKTKTAKCGKPIGTKTVLCTRNLCLIQFFLFSHKFLTSDE